MKSLLNLPTLVILCIALTFSACYEHETIVTGGSDYPSLSVFNQMRIISPSRAGITTVSLVGYEFDSLSIGPNGDYQIFILDKGMSAGYEDINVTVKYILSNTRGPVIQDSTSIIVDFTDRETTVISLREGDDGKYYLE